MRPDTFAVEAEVAVLSAMLMDSDAITTALSVVDAGMFSHQHRPIFAAMEALFQRAVAVDPVSLNEHMAGKLNADYIAKILDAVPTSANVSYHAGIVRDRWQMRMLSDAGTKIVHLSSNPEGRTPAEVVDEAERLVFACAKDGASDGPEWIKKILYPTFQRIEEIQAAKGGITGLASGLTDLDELTAGFQKGDLIIIGARPSMGKTALVTSIALEATLRAGVPSVMYSYEMSKQQVVQRLLCSEGLVNLHNLLRGRLRDDDYGRLAQVAGMLNTAPMYIEDGGAQTVNAIRASARRLKAEHPDLGLIIVDYIQLMEGGGDSENRNQEVSAISRGLKRLAKELDLPVIALSQLSRKLEDRANKRPQMSDLRESGSIEQDADLVMFLFREEYYNPTDASLANKAELIVSKQRNGPTGMVELYFRKECARFEGMKSESRRVA